jgi:hypothetical protein
MTTRTVVMIAAVVASTSQAPLIGNAKAEALAAFNRLIDASALCDYQEVGRLTSPDGLFIRPDGRLQTRESYIKDTRPLCKPGPRPGLRDVQVRAYDDDTAIVTAVLEPNDTKAATPLRLTMVWVKRDGRWVSVHSHLSSIERF